jgi:hypothetical protein
MVSFTALPKFIDNQTIHMVELEFFDLLGLKPNKVIYSLAPANRIKNNAHGLKFKRRL